jgi:hypothetical protein
VALTHWICAGLLATAAGATWAQVRSPSINTPTAALDPRLLDTHDGRFLVAASDADAVVIARVDSRESYWSAGHEIILTRFELGITKVVKGAAPARMTLVEEGGEVGNIGLRVSHGVDLAPGASYVLLLRSGPFGTRVKGGDEGTWKLESTDPAVDPVLRRLPDFLEPAKRPGGPK